MDKAINRKKVLWVDDEIDLLKSHIIYLEEKGYDVTPATNGDDALDLIQRENFDVALLDEMMPGRDGLSTLLAMKEIRPNLPAIMITKNEEESLMNQAIGSKIDDYLTKPVNPSQILLALKKITEGRKLSEQKISQDYVSEFNRISAAVQMGMGWSEWADLHLKLSGWEIDIGKHSDTALMQSLTELRAGANVEFARFVEKNYIEWVNGGDGPPLTPGIAGEYIIPALKAGKNVLFIVVDCMKLDQWLAIEDLLGMYFHISRDYYYSILPTATPYSRNALFAGMFPADIERRFNDIWLKGEEDETSSNRYERQLLDSQLVRAGMELKRESKYFKLINPEEGKNLERRISSLFDSPLVSLVVDFVDMLTHGRATSDVIMEMVPNEAAYRSVVRSWFEHSPLYTILKAYSGQKDTVVVMTTDHGAIRAQKGSKVIGDRETSTNLRYKYGKNLKVEPKQAIIVENPAHYKLPRRGLNTCYIIAKEDYFFLYPNNYNRYFKLFRGSLQHGGVSLEEMILPIYILEGK